MQIKIRKYFHNDLHNQAHTTHKHLTLNMTMQSFFLFI
jgi:hypothetical protein